MADVTFFFGQLSFQCIKRLRQAHANEGFVVDSLQEALWYETRNIRIPQLTLIYHTRLVPVLLTYMHAP